MWEAAQYEQLGEHEQRDYWAAKQGSSMEKKLLETNIYHFLNGYPRLTLTGTWVVGTSVGGLPRQKD